MRFDRAGSILALCAVFILALLSTAPAALAKPAYCDVGCYPYPEAANEWCTCPFSGEVIKCLGYYGGACGEAYAAPATEPLEPPISAEQEQPTVEPAPAEPSEQIDRGSRDRTGDL